MKTELASKPPVPTQPKSTATGPEKESLTLDVLGDLIVIDEDLVESVKDHSSFTDREMAFLSKSLGPGWIVDGEPTAGMVATMLTVKLGRGKNWDSEIIEEVILIVLAWLTNNLVPVEED